MTRAEQLAEQEAGAREAVKTKKARLAKVQAAQRAEARKALTTRQLHVGKLAHEAGLLRWGTSDLMLMFRMLGHLENPLQALGSLLPEYPGEDENLPCGNGCAHRGDGVSPCRADLGLVHIPVCAAGHIRDPE